MANFNVSRIGDGVYCVLDEGGASFYILEGRDKAVVIDTGVTPGEKIMPVIRKYTQKPLELILTHAHVDHMHHMDEFETVYMSHREFELPKDMLESMMGGKNLDLAGTIDISTGSVIDMGDDQIEICSVPGHTPGSIVALDRGRDLLFTGDAIGSGCGVWMQVPGAVPLAGYLQNLISLEKWLVERGGRMKFWGGHSFQRFQSTLILNYNPLSMGLLCDLIDLVEQVVKGQIVGRPSNVDKIMDLSPILYASYGRAELQYNPERIG